MNRLQKWGGLAALGHGAAYLVAIIFFMILLFPLMDSSPGQYLVFVEDNYAIMYVGILIAYWVPAIALVIMALALYERLKAGAPALAQTATVFGLIWAGLIIASANLMLHNLGVVAALYGTDPAQAAAAWTALEAVENGIVSGNELVGSLWVLLLSVAALRAGELSRGLNYLGMVLGIAGILTIVPALATTMIMIFGPGMIVWSMWIGIVMLRRNSHVTMQKPITLAAR
jgi:hypothetical protein